MVSRQDAKAQRKSLRDAAPLREKMKNRTGGASLITAENKQVTKNLSCALAIWRKQYGAGFVR